MSDKFTVYIICSEVTGSSQKQSNTTVVVLTQSVCRTAIGKWAFVGNLLFLSSLDITLCGRVEMTVFVMPGTTAEAVFL
jgi:hypothetical protein